MSTTKRKSSTRSKVHPYLNLRNWMPDGSCVFWNDANHNPDLYNSTIALEFLKERGIVIFQDNVGKNHSIR